MDDQIELRVELKAIALVKRYFESRSWHVEKPICVNNVKKNVSERVDFEPIRAAALSPLFVPVKSAVLVDVFETSNQEGEVDARVADLDSLPTTLFADTRPVALLLSACRDRDFFNSNCAGVGIT